MTPMAAAEHVADSMSDAQFAHLRQRVFDWTGIHLGSAKKMMVCGRLKRRLHHYDLHEYGSYLALIDSPNGAVERQIAIDLLTTNETHFFREPKHFQFLTDRILPDCRPPLRIWSAASSSGEEAYSLAMVLAERWGAAGDWEVLGTDISTRVLEQARSGRYSLARKPEIPPELLRRYCLKGIRSQEGVFRIVPELMRQVRFEQVNLTQPIPSLGVFDVIFLRNVLIYFDPPTKRQVVTQVKNHLKRSGFLLVGHSESLNGLCDDLSVVAPSVYRAS